MSVATKARLAKLEARTRAARSCVVEEGVVQFTYDELKAMPLVLRRHLLDVVDSRTAPADTDEQDSVETVVKGVIAFTVDELSTLPHDLQEQLDVVRSRRKGVR